MSGVSGVGSQTGEVGEVGEVRGPIWSCLFLLVGEINAFVKHLLNSDLA